MEPAGGLLKLGESILNTAKVYVACRIWGNAFLSLIIVCFVNSKASTVLEEVGRVRFEHCKACRRIGESVLITVKRVGGF